jgi:xanthine dehydrogenase YagS FAD-binding subunit
MIPFQWVDAQSGADAAALLRLHGIRAQPIASGGDLLEILKEGIAGPTLEPPAVLVNLATAPELASITRQAGGWRLGAMASLSRLRHTTGVPAMLHEAIDRLASPQLRARTTLGGNLLQRPRCMYFRHPDVLCFKKGGTECPASTGPVEAYPGAIFPGVCHAGHPSDLAPVLIALQARAEIVGPASSRSLPLEEIYADAGFNRHSETVLAPDEVLVAVTVPNGAPAQAFEKVAPRLANEFALASAAVALEGDDRVINAARVVLSGIAPQPFVMARAGDLLRGRRPEEVSAASIANQALETDTRSGVTATRAWAARLAIERAIARALTRLRAEP